MIRGIHYFSTGLKTKIDVIPRGCFKTSYIKSIGSEKNRYVMFCRISS